MAELSPRRAVVLIAFAELLGTSLWFSANGVGDALLAHWQGNAVLLGQLTSAVQAGFIGGTLLLALTGLADRFAASRIFLAASIFGALANALFVLPGNSFELALLWRFLTGVALAGIYPLGMKLVFRWEPARAGRALGWLVGMLVIGTAFPHFLRAVSIGVSWQFVVAAASLFALLGGLIVLWVGENPGAPPTRPVRFRWGQVLKAFAHPGFRAAAGGYFGHMWELYAVWTLVPFLLAALFPALDAAGVSLASFAFIALGGVGCVAGGLASGRFGSARVAFLQLAVSGSICLGLPWLGSLPPVLLCLLLLAWGVSIAGDSPQFSALVARHAPAESTGSALAIVNGIGFTITVLSISLIAPLWESRQLAVTWLLAPGPALGLLLLSPLLRRERSGR